MVRELKEIKCVACNYIFFLGGQDNVDKCPSCGKSYPLPDEWVRPTCFVCNKEFSDVELALGLMNWIFPGCDFYDAGGYCKKRGFGSCGFDSLYVCESCSQAPDWTGTVYVGDACLELWGDDEDYEVDGWWDEPY